MKPESDPLLNLFRAAREADPTPRFDAPPFGFTTRILAQARTSLPDGPWERLSLQALIVAFAVTLLCFVAPDFQIAQPNEDDLLAQAFLQTGLHP
jgi:hypothetical protein